MPAETLRQIEERHEPHWISRTAFPILSLLLLASQAVMGFAIYHHNTWLVVLLIPIVSHLMHGQLIGLHEASHSLLRKSRRLNDFDGFLIAAFSI